MISLGVALLLIGVNLANDYFDYRSGADPPVGVGSRPLQSGVLAPTSYLTGSFVAFGLAGLAGVILALASPPLILLIGFLGALLGFFYTAPPLRLGYRGLGELIVFLTLGVGATLGAYVVTTADFQPRVVLASLPIALTVTALLHANNLRDLTDDARSGKRTLAVRLGKRRAEFEYACLIAGAEAAVLVLALVQTPLVLVALVTLPQAWRLAKPAIAGAADGRYLMRETATLHLRLATILALGYAASRFV
jgi:1,4-dihydroxy-2-naphthoate octaprenyltransferase